MESVKVYGMMLLSQAWDVVKARKLTTAVVADQTLNLPHNEVTMSKAKTSKTDDLFNALSQAAAPVDKKGTSKKKDKPKLDLTPDEQKAFESFCAADVVYKMAEGKQGAAKSMILPVLRRKLLEKWLEEGHKTDNPTIQTNNARANFVVREILKIEIPEKADGEPGSVKDRLLEAGFSEDEAQAIYEREFTEKTELGFKSLSKLRQGDPAEQKVVNKLIKLVVENFSPDEQRLLLTRETKVEVNDGFLDRAVQHCPTVERLDALLNVVAPQWVLSHMTYQGKDLKAAVADLTGGELPSVEAPVKTEEFYSSDNQWKAVAKGAEASLYKVNGTEEVFMGTKKCSGIDHARNSCRKWMRDPEARSESLASFAAKK